MTDIKKPSDQPGATTATQIYITGPNWPHPTNAPNPWSRHDWNLTNQGRIYKRDKAEADRLAQAAGHQNALAARFDTAR